MRLLAPLASLPRAEVQQDARLRRPAGPAAPQAVLRMAARTVDIGLGAGPAGISRQCQATRL